MHEGVVVRLCWDPNLVFCCWVPNSQHPNDFWESSSLTNLGLPMPVLIIKLSRRLTGSTVGRTLRAYLRKHYISVRYCKEAMEEEYVLAEEIIGNEERQHFLQLDKKCCEAILNPVNGKRIQFYWRRMTSTSNLERSGKEIWQLENILREYLMTFPDRQLDIHPEFPTCQLLAHEIEWTHVIKGYAGRYKCSMCMRACVTISKS